VLRGREVDTDLAVPREHAPAGSAREVAEVPDDSDRRAPSLG
jgi:hypothetical protein